MSNIAIFMWAQFSHTKPVLNLIRELVSRGNNVYCFNDAKYKKVIEEYGGVFVEYPIAINKRKEEFVDYEFSFIKEKTEEYRKEKEKLIKLIELTNSLLMKCIAIDFEELLPIIEKMDIDMIIYDCCSYSGKLIADKLKIKNVAYSTCLAIGEDYLFSDFNKNLPLIYAIDMPFLKEFNKYEQNDLYEKIIDSINSCCKENNISELPFFYTTNPKSDKNILFVNRDLQPKLSNKKEYLFANPKNNNIKINNNLDDSSFDFDEEDIVVYMASGHYLKYSNKIYNTILSVFNNTNVKFVISKGDLKINTKKLGSNIILKEFVDQEKILKRANLFITHGGYNSITEAIDNEVPMLVLPIANDQFVNSDIISKKKLGRTLSWDSFNANNFIEAVQDIIKSDEYVTNIRQYKMKEKYDNYDYIIDQIMA